jgi:hypothetical protein
MSGNWHDVVDNLKTRTQETFLTCPDEILRFRYGVITHSDAGKLSFDQYFGHWVHMYAWYLDKVYDVNQIIAMTRDPSFDYRMIKRVFWAIVADGVRFTAIYGGQKLIAEATKEVYESMDSVGSADDMALLLQTYHTYLSQLYWWFHWYFPWGIGPVLCHRQSAEDIKEMVRLSGPLDEAKTA